MVPVHGTGRRGARAPSGRHVVVDGVVPILGGVVARRKGARRSVRGRRRADVTQALVERLGTRVNCQPGLTDSRCQPTLTT